MSLAEHKERVPPLSANIGQACYSCFREAKAPGERLSACLGCKRVVYCGAACQKRDWGKHKSALGKFEKKGPSTAVRFFEAIIGGEPGVDHDQLNTFTYRCMHEDIAALEGILGRKPSIAERNLIGWEPKCAQCGVTDKAIRFRNQQREGQDDSLPLLQSCPTCHTTFFCAEHQDSVNGHHKEGRIPLAGSELTQCQANQRIREDIQLSSIMMNAPGPGTGAMVWAPERIKKNWSSFKGHTWEQEFEQELKEGLGLPPQLPMAPILRAVSEGLSLPMVILYGLDILNGDDKSWTTKKKLVVHVLGPAELEVQNAMVFEEILHRLPDVKELELVFCGPEINRIVVTPQVSTTGFRTEMDTCPECEWKGRKRVQDHIGRPYHLFVQEKEGVFVKPDLAVAFNSGISEENTDLWKPTIELLVKMKIPSVFTAFNGEEAKNDSAVLQDAGAALVPDLGPCPNPWGSLLLKTEPGKVNGFYSVNGWLAGGFC